MPHRSQIIGVVFRKNHCSLEDRSMSKEEIEGLVLFLTSRSSLSELSSNIHISFIQVPSVFMGKMSDPPSCLLPSDLMKSMLS